MVSKAIHFFRTVPGAFAVSTPTLVAAISFRTLLVALTLNTQSKATFSKGRAERRFTIAVVEAFDASIDGAVAERHNERTVGIDGAFGAAGTVIGAESKTSSTDKTGEALRYIVGIFVGHPRPRPTLVLHRPPGGGRWRRYVTTRPHITARSSFSRIERGRAELDFSGVTGNGQPEESHANDNKCPKRRCICSPGGFHDALSLLRMQ